VNSSHRKIMRKRIILDFLIGLLLLIYLFAILRTSNLDLNNDFRTFYISAESFMRGENIYSSNALGTEQFKAEIDAAPVLHPNLNPPFFTLLVLPFATLNYNFAFSIFSILSVLSGAIAIWAIHRELFTNDSKPVLRPTLVLYLAYFPTLAAIILGQLSIYLLLILTLVWVHSRQGRDEATGILLGLALAVKLYTGLFLIFFLIRRRWRVVAWYITSFIIFNFVSLLLFRIDTFKNYLETLVSIYWYNAVWNASFLGFSSRIIQNINGTSIESTARVVSLLLSLSLLALILWIAWPDKKRVSEKLALQRYDLCFALYLVAMLLISPLGWMYYFPLLLFPFLIIWRIANQYNQSKLAKVAIAAWLLSTIPVLQNSTVGNNIFLTLIRGGIYSYSLLILISILLYQIISLKKMEAQTDPQIGNKIVQTIPSF
jgi:alpha-1,2-mannosyltransferase